MSDSLTNYLAALARWWRVVASITLLAVIAASAYLILTPASYKSSAVLFVSTPRDDANTYYRGDLYSKERVTSYAALGRSPEIAQRVINSVMLDTDPATLIGDVAVVPVPGTVLLSVSATGSSPQEAQAIGQSYVDELQRSVSALETVPGALTPRAELIEIQPPSYPTEPAGFSHWLILAGGTGLGLILGCFTVALVTLLDGRIRRPEDAAEAAGVPVLAEFAGLVDWKQDDVLPSTSESGRSLRAALDRLTVLDARSILVTSAEAGAGKTGVALTLARALADRGSRVVLLDFDARTSQLADALELTGAISVQRLLIDDAAAERGRHRAELHLPQVDDIPDSNRHGVAVVPFGHAEDNPGGTVDKPLVAPLLRDLRSRYEWIVVDTPAVDDFSDATRLASQCDATLLVARAGHTSFDTLRCAALELTDAGASVRGVVFVGEAPLARNEKRDQASDHGDDAGHLTPTPVVPT